MALLSTPAAAGLPTEHGRHVRDTARMLRLLGHDCVLIGLATKTSKGNVVPHAGGTRRRLVMEVRGDGPPVVPNAGAVLEEERPDVLWLLEQRGARAFLEGARGGSGPRMRIVADFHGLSCLADSGREIRRERPDGDPAAVLDDVRFALAASDAVVARAGADVPAIEREGVPPERIRLVPFGVRFPAPAGGPAGDGDRPVGRVTRVGFVGPLVRASGAHLLLQAVAAVPDLAVAVRVEARGPRDPAYAEELEAMAEADPRIALASGTSADGVDGLDLLVVPSLGPGACPVVALTALAGGVRVLASDRSGLGDLLGEEGLLFGSGSAAAITEALQREAGAGGPTARSPVQPYRPGIEEEALEMERLALEVSGRDPPAPLRPADDDAPTRLVGGGIDYPDHLSTIPRSAVRLAGWGLTTPSPVSRVEVSLNGVALGRARPALARPVLLEAFASPESAICGFEHWIDLTLVPDTVTRARFDVDVVAMDGSRFALWPVDVELEQREQVEPEDAERASVLEARVRRAAGTPPPPRARTQTRKVRLVAFGHSLGYGGAQLYLFELLRRMAGQPGLSATVVSPSDGPLRDDYEALGIPVLVSGFPGVSDVDLYAGRQVELAAWMRQEGFDVVLGNTLLAFPWIDAADRLGLPAIWAVHESYDLSTFWPVHLPGTKIHPLVRERMTAALSSATAVVFEADATRRMFERYGDARRFVKIDYGIDTRAIRAYRAGFDRTAARRQLGIPQSADVILCLGTIEPRKSQALLAQAFRWAVAAHPDAYLALVGDAGGSYTEAIRDYLEVSGMARRSRVVKVVKDTYRWYGVADLFCCPSDLESLPRSILEAMAFDVPVAAASAFGVPELIEDGRTGYLGGTRDLMALQDLLGRVLDQPRQARREVGLAGGRVVAERHDSRGYADAYGALVWGLVEDPTALPGAILGREA